MSHFQKWVWVRLSVLTADSIRVRNSLEGSSKGLTENGLAEFISQHNESTGTRDQHLQLERPDLPRQKWIKYSSRTVSIQDLTWSSEHANTSTTTQLATALSERAL